MIHHFVTTKAALALKSLGVGIGAVIAAVVIDERTHIPLGPTLGAGIFLAGIIFWIGQKLQKITDEIEELHSRMDHLPCGPRADKCLSKKP